MQTIEGDSCICTIGASASHFMPELKHTLGGPQAEDDVVLRLAAMKPYETANERRCVALVERHIDELKMLVT